MVKKNTSLYGFDPLCFFSKLGPREKRPAFFTSGSWTIIAWNPSRTIRGKRASVLRKLKKIHVKRQSRRSKLPFIGGAIGYVDYDRRGMFHIYDSAVLWDGREARIIGDDRFFDDVTDIHARPMPSSALPEITWVSSASLRWYAKAFDRVKRGIRNGEYYQLNLTYPFFTKSAADHRRLFVELLRFNPAPCASYVEHGKQAIVSLSPERFVTIDDGMITTSPIKGTRPRGKNPKDDRAMAKALLSSEKEAAELNMITDLLRNDIGKVSLPGTVKVVKHRELQKNPSVWHTYSVIRGRLDPSIDSVDAFASMFPGGSVTGCPKVAAMEEIENIERSSRGAYCGSMVLLSDDGFFDSSILIRTIVAKKRKLSLGVGGGIVADSDCKDEYAETLKKAQPFLTFSRSQVRRFLNGTEISVDDRRGKPLDASFRRARGFFETILVKDGRACDLRAHLQRLQHSTTLPASIPSINHWISFAIKNAPSPEARLKVVVIRHDVLIDVRPYVRDPSWSQGVAVTVVTLRRRSPDKKSLPFHREHRAFATAQAKGFHEVLLRSHGRILEAAHSNLFWMKKGVLFTAESGMLPGITRHIVLRLAQQEGIDCRFSAASLPELLDADEIFLTRSLAGIVPVTFIDGSIIDNGKPGAVTQRLLKAFEARKP